MVLVRSHGMWAETDSAVFTRYIRNILQTGELIPSTGAVYGNGYGYQVLGVFLTKILGISLSSFQLDSSALLAIWVIFPAWLFYQKLLQRRAGTTLAILLFFAQPDVLFPLFRATHEKFTRGLMFLVLYLFLCGLHSRQRPRRLMGFVFAFYFSVLGMLTYNNLLATSFLVGLGFTLIFYVFVVRAQILPNRLAGMESVQASIRKLAYVVLLSMVLIFLYIFYLYPPGRSVIETSSSVWQGILSLVLATGQSVTPAYVELVNSGWRSFNTYLVINAATWFLLIGSMLIWLWQSGSLLVVRYLSNKTQAKSSFTERDLALWAFFGAFASLGAFAIAMDSAGALAGNIQLRIYPNIAMLAAPLLANQLLRWKANAHHYIQHSIGAVYIVVLCMLYGLSFLKATNEPFFSNKWTFVVPSELQAHSWVEEKLQANSVWYGFDERVSSGLELNAGEAPITAIVDQFEVAEDTADFLVSRVTLEQGLRLQATLPFSAGDLKTYDNGQTQIYHRRPYTPYQE